MVVTSSKLEKNDLFSSVEGMVVILLCSSLADLLDDGPFSPVSQCFVWLTCWPQCSQIDQQPHFHGHHSEQVPTVEPSFLC